jgi:hypothetical protein
MSFETVSLLLSWMEMGLLLAILFNSGSTTSPSRTSATRLIVKRLAVDEGGQGLAFLGAALFETGNAPSPAFVPVAAPITLPPVSSTSTKARRASRPTTAPVSHRTRLATIPFSQPSRP